MLHTDLEDGAYEISVQRLAPFQRHFPFLPSFGIIEIRVAARWHRSLLLVRHIACALPRQQTNKLNKLLAMLPEWISCRRHPILDGTAFFSTYIRIESNRIFLRSSGEKFGKLPERQREATATGSSSMFFWLAFLSLCHLLGSKELSKGSFYVRDDA